MIRYDVALPALEAAVDAVSAKWRTAAAKKTAKFIAAAKYNESKGSWSTIKSVYMALQNNKCIFCERQFESEEYGKIEFDVEHFRPKSSVISWPDPDRHSVSYAFATGQPSATGYYWLAYDLWNYAASCKVCNSNLKANYFPIAANRVTAPGSLTGEKPFLCYPIGSVDTDPEQLVTFIATTAVPKAKSGHDRKRGQIIIDFFELNKRDQLHKERANLIMLMGQALANISSGNGDQTDQAIVNRLKQPILPHTACLRAFEQSWAKDPEFGRKVWQACRAYYAAGDWANRPTV